MVESIGQSPEQKELSETIPPKEIERRFLVADLPENIEQYENKEIKQGYLAVGEEEVRLRQKGDKYYITYKKGSGLERIELPEDEEQGRIPKELFDALWAGTEGRRVEKTRYSIPHGEHTIELNLFHGSEEGAKTIEVEFASKDKAKEFEPPEWFGREVTDDPRYNNQNLAQHGFPIEAKEGSSEEPKGELDISPELQSQIQKLSEMVQIKLHEIERTIIVEIAGGSASGKTSAVADKIRETFGDDAIILSMDNYYFGPTYMKEQAAQGNILNYDQPEAINLELLREDLKKLKSGEAIDEISYDFQNDPVKTGEKIQPKRIIILEGLFALNEKISDQGDVKAFVDIGTHGRIIRRLLRDVKRTGQKPEDILRYFAEVVEPMHQKYIDSTKENADIVLSNEYKAEVEAKKSGLNENQIKFRAEGFDENLLRRLGGERLASVTQKDKYYNPHNRDLSETGELLRIREEGGKRILTYKGPRKENQDYRERPKFEFEIDKETEEAFLGMYGGMIKTISKDRTYYQLDGIIISFDRVRMIDGEEQTNLGNFVEIRANDPLDSKKVEEVMEKLNLKKEEGIKEAYLEM